ncbi:MAG: tRNA epoxyqueuosine(34) reductase QueG [Actinobacteria bacterium]|nr:tRNA epoxyqueuosine(34) reductase QueG [Actinomycetota bacterium]
MITDPHKSAAAVKTLAGQSGFDLVGITSAEPLPKAGQNLLQAVEHGHTADLSYLNRHPLARSGPQSLAPWARSVICLGINYNYFPVEVHLPLSRYALGRDYHLVLTEKLQLFSHQLGDLLGRDFRSRIAVDTTAIMEKLLAQRAGLGWQGKNTLLVNKTFGSWIFLGEVLTDLDLFCDDPVASRCGRCRVCIDACPTGALSEPGFLDARKCLSYLTIEYRGDVWPEVARKAGTAKEPGQCLYGCDICQQVCPFNCHTPRTLHEQFHPHPELLDMRFDDLTAMSQPQFERVFAETPVARLSYQRFRRNSHLMGFCKAES